MREGGREGGREGVHLHYKLHVQKLLADMFLSCADIMCFSFQSQFFYVFCPKIGYRLMRHDNGTPVPVVALTKL